MSNNSKINAKQKSWSNLDNAAFYENVTIDKMQEIAGSAGIDAHCDLKLLDPYITQADSILEVGAGYGRVLDYLTNIGYQGKITALERSVNLCHILQKNHSSNANIIQGDLIDIQLEQRFDLVLWLWAGIADFTITEQALIVEKLFSLVTKDGFLMLDTLDTTANIIGAVHSDGQQHVINLNGAEISVYGPSINEIKRHALKASFASTNHISYKTTTGRNRLLHILRK